MTEVRKPIAPQPHPSHQWAEDKPQTRCVLCGAYKHLSSGFFPCPDSAPGDEKNRPSWAKTAQELQAVADALAAPLAAGARMTSVAPGGTIPTARAQAFEAISQERDYQDALCGPLHAHPHEVGAWLLRMEDLLAGARAAWCSQRGDLGALDALRRTLACGVACLEQHGVVPRL